MTRTVVIYESNYGFTKQYAQWISQDLSCPLLERKAVRPKDLDSCDTIVYGGGLYAGGVSGIRLLTQNWQRLSDKNIVLFTCGLADPENPANATHIREGLAKSLSPEMMRSIKMFHLRGGISYPDLNIIHKTMMSMLRRMLLKKDAGELKTEDRLLLDTYGQKIDFTNRAAIRPVVEYVRSQTNPS